MASQIPPRKGNDRRTPRVQSPAQPAPDRLSVVDCRVFLNTDGKPCVCRRHYPDQRVPALAVPDALWADEEFLSALASRMTHVDDTSFVDSLTDLASDYDCTLPQLLHDVLRFAHRELAARAGRKSA